MATAFYTYLKAVKLTVNAVDYTIPVWNLAVRAESWTGSGSIAQQAPDGFWRQKISGWHVYVNFDGHYSWGTSDNDNAKTAIEALYNYGTGTLDLDPVDDPGVKVLTVVPADGNSPAEARFSGHIRNRPQRISLVTQALQTSIPMWLTEAISDPHLITEVAGANTILLAAANIGVTQAASHVTAWADQSAGGTNDFTTGTDMAVSTKYGYGYHPQIDADTSALRTAANNPLGAAAGPEWTGTIWMVVRFPTALTQAGDVFGIAESPAGATYTRLRTSGGNLNFTATGGISHLGSIGVVDGDPHLIEIQIDTTAGTIVWYVDGVQDFSGALLTLPGAVALSAFWIGTPFTGASADANIDTWVPFVMIDNAIPSAARSASVQQLLARRYGILSLLA